ncbi:MAG: hypothetical protein HOP12_05460 [Candidatus Eisenbacteria bacterium]|uniref:NADH:quinone oxidoreductase/Mrp antiporter membrane subunit domain-containing protein n=1 Tax=Eiseniibacteriota bacterium TaxID=2212470 RepID=A0A849SJ04_UNCEI|nr:hypothetical protein [Candidatus Eisenbacteria bacterium]
MIAELWAPLGATLSTLAHSKWLSLAPESLALWCALLSVVTGVVLFAMERREGIGIGRLGALAALAAIAALKLGGAATLGPLTLAVVVAALARDPDELLHTECGVKLLWVLGGAWALSFAGRELLTLATGTSMVREQWAVLALGLEPRYLWSTALPLTLLAGLVLIGGFPFHFWVADLFQGARPWLAPLAVAALQVCGVLWIESRLVGIAAFPDGARLANGLLHQFVVMSLGAGAVTLLVQRRPERFAGTLAGLHGALALAMIVGRDPQPGWLAAWSAHLMLALSGANTLTRFLPAHSDPSAAGAPLFRRHPIEATIGSLSLLSLAGMPGLPGSWVWLDVARLLVRSGHSLAALALAIAWVLALSGVVMRLRIAFGSSSARVPLAPSPRAARVALVASGVGVALLGWSFALGGFPARP